MNKAEKTPAKPGPVTTGRSGPPTLLTRRQLLAGVGQAALLTTFTVGCVPLGDYPWADGTFWDDGLGWTD
ncbi:MAG: hypothetical protein ACR2QJ_03270 [Geminicoccaceae bacterium]